MAFLHCHVCRWEQDDFWTRRYNPVAFYVRQILPSLWSWPKNNRQWTWRDEVRLHLRYLTRALNPRTYLKMRWWTQRTWVRAGRPGCPKCGARLCLD